MATLLQDIFCIGVVTYAGATDWVLPTHTAAAPCPLCSKTLVWSLMLVLLHDWVLPVLLLHHAHFAPGCIAVLHGVLFGRCYCCSYAVLIQQPICNVFDLPILVWALLLGLPGEWRQ